MRLIDFDLRIPGRGSEALYFTLHAAVLSSMSAFGSVSSKTSAHRKAMY